MVKSWFTARPIDKMKNICFNRSPLFWNFFVRERNFSLGAYRLAYCRNKEGGLERHNLSKGRALCIAKVDGQVGRDRRNDRHLVVEGRPVEVVFRVVDQVVVVVAREEVVARNTLISRNS